MRSTFKLLFYINRQKVKKNGRCPVMGHVTLDGKVSQYSTGLEIEPDLWDAKKGKAFADGRKTGNHRRKKKRVEQAELIVGGIGGKSEVRLQKERGFLRLRLG